MPFTSPAGRRPSLRGIVQQDISQGKERTRAWPRKRNKAKTKAEQQKRDAFASAQMAGKFISTQQMTDFINATNGTPLLPRDLMTAMFYGRLTTIITPEGNELWPMQGRKDISDGLDVLGKTPGTTLRRGEQIWEGIPAHQPQLFGAQVTRIGGQTINPANAEVPIVFDTETIDQFDYWNPSLPTVLRLPLPGWYLVNFSTFAIHGVNSYRQIRITLNGFLQNIVALNLPTANGETPMSVSAIIFGNQGDQVECKVAAFTTNRVWTNNRVQIVSL